MKKSMLFVFLIVPAVVFVATSAMALTLVHSANNGALCRAANLTQAFELGWDHSRVYNPGSRDLWVICPIQRSLDADWQSGGAALFPFDDYYKDDDMRIYAWFGASANPAAQVTCILREMAWDVTDTAATNSASFAISQTGGGLPEAVSQTFDVSTFGSGSFTATCKLPPGTGINALIFINPVLTNAL